MESLSLEYWKRKIGHEIEILDLDDPYKDRYIGKRGFITEVSQDPWGDVRLDGTWGSIGIYPEKDSIRFTGNIDKSITRENPDSSEIKE